MLKVHLCGPIRPHGPFTCIGPFRLRVALLHLLYGMAHMVMKGYHMGLFTPIPRSRGSEVEMRLLCVECEISLSN